MKKNLLTVLLVSTLSLPTFAGNAPAKCPSVEALQAQKFKSVACTMDNFCTAAQAVSIYNTNEYWGVLMHFDASSLEAALEKANNALPTLTYQNGPIKLDEDTWKCSYKTANGSTVNALHHEDPALLVSMLK